MKRIIASLLLWFGITVAAYAQFASPAVQSVNSQTGNVLVPTYQRQVSSAVTVPSNGTVSWTFPSSFNSTPSCFYSLVATDANYNFYFPKVSAVSSTAVSLQITAQPTTLQILSISLPITLNVTSNIPSGTTVTFSCLAPL